MIEDVRVRVIDLFAGPGGLGEGFSRFITDRGERVFSLCLSIEKEKYAHQTLRLRSFFRQFPPLEAPEDYYRILRGEITTDVLEQGAWQKEWQCAEALTLHAELGNPKDNNEIRTALADAILKRKEPAVLIGGPPCQAYSVVGRARLRGVDGYSSDKDPRHLLYREYLDILSRVRPAVFVMENVKGILSSRLQGEEIFQRILKDLSCPPQALNTQARDGNLRYTIYPVVETSQMEFLVTDDPSAYVVRCEDIGIPQKRHRVILLGVREDLKVIPGRIPSSDYVSTGKMIGGMPKIRSKLSNRFNSDTWHAVFNGGLSDRLVGAVAKATDDRIAADMRRTALRLSRTRSTSGGEYVIGDMDLDPRTMMGKWILDPRIEGFCNHQCRSHMTEDLYRYLFAACYAKHRRQSPKLCDFPPILLPVHKNARTAALSKSLFADRFRVQLRDEPATTITSHISKDGHYYIHFDPLQCRSMTVREAARLQTFPDNYLFCGPRTAQYIQVGNAVPPLLAYHIAELVHGVLKDSGVI
ncbi:DNA cytosine methyltransferase [soil metagenome]